MKRSERDAVPAPDGLVYIVDTVVWPEEGLYETMVSNDRVEYEHLHPYASASRAIQGHALFVRLVATGDLFKEDSCEAIEWLL